MRKLISLMHVSLDGFTAGPDGEMDCIGSWMDDELWEHVTTLLTTVDGVIFGRVTYQLFVDYWPVAATNPSSTRNEAAFAYWIENVPKSVTSSTLKKVAWKNTELIDKNFDREIAKKKAQPGKHLVILGSPTLTNTLINLERMDEFQIYIHPVVVGKGKPFLKGLAHQRELQLIENRGFNSGVLGLRYRTSRQRLCGPDTLQGPSLTTSP